MKRKKKQDSATISWLIRVAEKNKYYVVLLALVQTVLGASVIGYALFLRGLIDHAVAGDRAGFWHYSFLLVALVVFLVCLRWIKRYLDEYIRSSVENCFKSRLFHQLLRRDYGQIRAIHSAEWMNRLTSDTKVAADGFAQVLPNFCEMSSQLLAAVIALIVMQPKFAYVIVPGGLVLIVVTFLFRTKLKMLHKSIQEKDGQLRVFYQERLNSQIVLRVFSKEEQTEEEQRGFLENHQRARMKRNWFSNLCNAGFRLVMNGAYVFGAIYCGFGILTGTMTYGTFTAVLQLVSRVQSPFANISGTLPQYYAMLASSERLREVEDYSLDQNDNAVSQSRSSVSFEKAGLRNVCFRYPDYDEEHEETAVLEDFSMEIRRGEFLAMSGPSGCGKSTVLKVLMALYPIEQGSQYVDVGTGEQEMNGAFRRLFSYVPQGNMLIQGSIREIVAFGDAEGMKEDRAIWEALSLACADRFVKELENGLDTVLGEQGAGLSEGQTQRLSIARALFSRRPVLLLDEATSALDLETEKQILQNLRGMRDQTIILVTHRPAALDLADRVIEF